jgi:hypothetical protein
MNDSELTPTKARFLVRVADNYDYMDSSAWYELGRYATLDEAIDASSRHVTRCIEDLYKPGMTGEELREYYVMFGEDPFITDLRSDLNSDAAGGCDGGRASDNRAAVLFSAWDFASRMAHIVVAVKSASGQVQSDKEDRR